MTWDAKLFFRGGVADDAKDASSSFLVGSSAFISWIFAKSITNASKKGGSYGVAGGFAYAAWCRAGVGVSPSRGERRSRLTF